MNTSVISLMPIVTESQWQRKIMVATPCRVNLHHWCNMDQVNFPHFTCRLCTFGCETLSYYMCQVSNTFVLSYLENCDDMEEGLQRLSSTWISVKTH